LIKIGIMKILIINPNSDQQMGRDIQKSAEDFVKARYEVVCKNTPAAPSFIETYEDMVKAAPGMIQLARKNESQFDAVVIACHYDPQLDLMKEILEKPVVGIGEASIKIASMLGPRFSILTTDNHSIPIHEELVRRYNLYEVLASVRAPEIDVEGGSEEELYLSTAKIAVEKDRADVIVLGCAGLTGLHRRLQQELDVPVLDGVVCALIIAAGLAEMDRWG
jgi:allantoin racemase